MAHRKSVTPQVCVAENTLTSIISSNFKLFLKKNRQMIDLKECVLSCAICLQSSDIHRCDDYSFFSH